MRSDRRKPSSPRWPLDRLGLLLCRLIVATYPPRFRRRFSTALVDAVRWRADDLRRERGTAGAARFWFRQLLDLAAGAVPEWLDRAPRRNLPRRPLESLTMEALRADLRFALRTLRKRPAVAVVIVATLAIGIGASTAIFSIIDAVILRPLPYERPDELLLILDDMRSFNISRAPLAEYEMRALLEGATLLESIQAFTRPFQGPLSSDDGEPEQVLFVNHSADYFAMLGIAPALGRATTAEDDRPLPAGIFGDPNAEVPDGVVTLGHDFWQRRFGGDPNVIGRIISLGSRDHEIIGVLPASFQLLLPDDLGGQQLTRPVDLFMPLQADIGNAVDGAGYLQVVGRLKPGVTLERAEAEIAAIAARLRDESARSGRAEIHMSAHRWGPEVARHVRPALLALLGAVGFVLLIACANVANLLLASAVGRRHEIAVRAALGAQRRRVIRQALTESLVLGLVGGAMGLLLAHWGTRALLLLQPAELPRAELVGVNPTVAGFTLGATLLAVLLFGTAPAIALSATRGSSALQDRGSAGGSRSRSRLRDGLVVVEVALSLVLLAGAGLTLQSFSYLRGLDPGFTADRVTTFGVTLPFFEYRDPDSRQAFMNTLHGSLEQLPGIERVGAASSLPLSGDLFAGTFHTLDMAEDSTGLEANYRGAGPGYFEAMRTRLLDGRTLEAIEDSEVIVVDQHLAERVFPGERAVGQRLRLQLPNINAGPPDISISEIVGVVANMRIDSLDGTHRSTVYFPYRRVGFGQMSFVVRSALSTADLLPGIRREVDAINPDLPIHDIRPLSAYIDDAVAPVRFTLLLIVLFGACALLLAAIGLYGVIANGVRQQTRDLGVRLAFGATGGRIVRLVVARGAMLAGIGVALGLAVSLPLTRALQSLFVGVSATDPATFTGISILLVAVALLACYVPARRAARLDPAASLRAD